MTKVLVFVVVCARPLPWICVFGNACSKPPKAKTVRIEGNSLVGMPLRADMSKARECALRSDEDAI